MRHPKAVSARVSRPLWLFAVLFASVVLLNAMVVGCGGGGGGGDTGSSSATESGGGDHGDGGTEAAGGEAAGGEMAAGVSVERGARIYAEKCALCHGATGHGDGPGAAALDPKPRNHTDGAYMNSRTNEELLEVIRNGKGQMTPWGSILSEDEMKSVLAYVRTLAQPPYEGPMPE